MSSSTEQAIRLLKDTQYFRDASDSLLEAMAEKMVPISAVKGQVFVEEGDLIHSILILEEGTLARTKLSVVAQELKSMMTSLRSMKDMSKAHDERVDNSILVDKVEGRGRVSGLLHSFDGEARAYATVSAEGKAKVWVLNGADFRDVLSETPTNCLDILDAMARELRSGSKSLRGLIEKVRKVETTEGEEVQLVIKVLCYDTTSWVSEGFKPAIEKFNKKQVEEFGEKDAVHIHMDYTPERLGERSATYAAGYDAVCLFVNDTANEKVLQTLSLLDVKMIAMRCAGFDRVDTKAAIAFGMTVARVPAYSPYAVAEHAVALLLAVNRKIARASMRVKMANFSLDGGLMGVDIHGKTVGVMGTGKIGQILCNIMLGFGANLICYDVYENEDIKKAGAKYVSKEEIYKQSDIIFLMMPLLPETHHTINDNTTKLMKKGVLLVNTSRGGLVHTKAVLKAIQNGIIAGVGMDVYENEQDYFFQDWSARQIRDPDLLGLLSQNCVVLTAHQAFFTEEAVNKIVGTTLENLVAYKKGETGLSHPNNCLPK